jgi:hypothetical protein
MASLKDKIRFAIGWVIVKMIWWGMLMVWIILGMRLAKEHGFGVDFNPVARALIFGGILGYLLEAGMETVDLPPLSKRSRVALAGMVLWLWFENSLVVGIACSIAILIALELIRGYRIAKGK